MRTPRSYLFVPGQKSDLFAKASAGQADKIILDLEDAVGADLKDQARENVAAWVTGGGSAIVRINGMESPWCADDLAAFADLDGVEIMVPKANAETVTEVANRLPKARLIALIETAQGLADVQSVVQVPGVVRLAFGNLDFASDMRIPDSGEVLDPARFQLVLASRLGNLPQPVDGVTPDFRNADVLTTDLNRTRAMGFTGKLCIHPSQVAPANTLLGPSEDELAWAKRVIDALEAAKGSVVQIDGKMIDTPLARKAEQLLSDAG